MTVYVYVHGTGKAARDMMFLTMAAEQPQILVLNYAPGPVDTAMQVEARTKTGDPELRTMFQSKYCIVRIRLSRLYIYLLLRRSSNYIIHK